MCKTQLRKVEQKMFVYWVILSTEFYYNFGGVLLKKIVLLQHLTVKITLRTSIFISGPFCICQHAASLYLIPTMVCAVNK